MSEYWHKLTVEEIAGIPPEMKCSELRKFYISSQIGVYIQRQ